MPQPPLEKSPKRPLWTRILYPHWWVLLLLSPIAVMGPAAALTARHPPTAAAPALYMPTFYVAAATVARAYRLLRGAGRWLGGRPLVRRYRTDQGFRMRVTLYLSLGANTVYALYKLAAGRQYRAWWLGAEALYYLLLSTARFLLLHHLRGAHRDPAADHRKYRFCGYLLLVLTAAVMGVAAGVLYGGKVITYPGHLIYAAAGYTFYSFGAAIAGSVRGRRLGDPIYAASRAIAMAAALVSVFWLQAAMLHKFGGSARWQRQMNLGTGAAVLLVVAAMAVYMIAHGQRAPKALPRAEHSADKTDRRTVQCGQTRLRHNKSL